MTVDMRKSLLRATTFLIITTAALLLMVLMGGSDEGSGETWYVDNDGGGHYTNIRDAIDNASVCVEDFLSGVEDFLDGLGPFEIAGLFIILVVVVMFVLAIMNKKDLILKEEKHWREENKKKLIDWGNHKLLFTSIGMLTILGIAAWVIEFTQPEFGFFNSFVAVTVVLTILFMAVFLKICKGSSSDENKDDDEEEDDKKDEYGIWKFLAWATGPLFIAGIISIALNYQFGEWDLFDRYSSGLHVIALSAVVAVLAMFVVIVFYFYLIKPKTMLQIDWTVQLGSRKIQFFPTWLFVLIGLSSISYCMYGIMKGFGIAKEGNTVEDIYYILDRIFGYEVTIPQTDFKIYLGIAFLVISAFMTVYMAYGLTYTFHMWIKGVHNSVTYFFVLITGLSIVFTFDILFYGIEMNIQGTTITALMAMTIVKIAGWCYGLSVAITKVKGIWGRKRMRNAWIKQLAAAIDGGKIKNNKKIFKIWAEAFEICEPEYWELRKEAAGALGEIGNDKAEGFAKPRIPLKQLASLYKWCRGFIGFEKPSAMDLLIKALKKDVDPNVKEEAREKVVIALWTIGRKKVGRKKAIPYLNLLRNELDVKEITWANVKNEYKELQKNAAGAIEEISNDKAMDLLIKAVKSKVRKEVVIALWSIGNKKAIPYLEAHSNDSDIGEMAREAVYNIQEKIATAAGGAEQKKLDYTSQSGIEFVLVPAGTFMMGSKEVEDDDAEPHQVAISQSFYMGKYQVTQAQWKMVMWDDPSHYRGNNKPVEKVSWDDCQKFVEKLNDKSVEKYRLPTEAEWEYSCRAGSTTKYCFWDDTDELKKYAWFIDNCHFMTLPVGLKRPNTWGLYDMHGNVDEWCQDRYAGNYPTFPVTDPSGPSEGSNRVVRGGSWACNAGQCTSAYRARGRPGIHRGYLGFRLVRSFRSDKH